MVGLVSALLVTAALAAASDTKPVAPASIRGLDPALYARYEPNSSGRFACLDGSATIPFSEVNDDYCDCPDGSDEPGTAACAQGYFYCKNEGHVPGRVLKSRVNDGLCDPECCDGSDEWLTGACTDRCQTIGKEHRAAVEAEAKLRRTGAKIRTTYINHAQKEKKRLEEDLKVKQEDLKTAMIDVEHARVNLEKAEARSKEEVEKKKSTPLYTSLLSHRLALTRLRSRTQRLQSELDTLRGILDELAKGYNPNYQDMAVKAAVVGFEELSKGPAEGEAEVDKEEEIADPELDELERRDLEAILLQEIGEGSDESGGGLLYRIDEYIPDALYDSWESVRDLAIDWMIRIGFLGRGAKGASKDEADSPHVQAARDKHSASSNKVNDLNRNIQDDEDTLNKLTSGFYGPQSEWKKLDGTCVDKVSGDYTYELCFFGRATQKSNKDHSSNNLGQFTGWKTDTADGSYERFERQYYQNGAKCWNGPMRSATVDLKCGKENALVSISEPEKCEYFFKVTSPALCWPAEESGAAGAGIKEEL